MLSGRFQDFFTILPFYHDQYCREKDTTERAVNTYFCYFYFVPQKATEIHINKYYHTYMNINTYYTDLHEHRLTSIKLTIQWIWHWSVLILKTKESFNYIFVRSLFLENFINLCVAAELTVWLKPVIVISTKPHQVQVQVFLVHSDSFKFRDQSRIS